MTCGSWVLMDRPIHTATLAAGNAAGHALGETLEPTWFYPVARLTGRHPAVVTTPPCRAPHHPITAVGWIGGGQIPRPGAVSRAHHGILFLDARPEGTRHGLEV
jgi:magnesium chelatase family protein